MTSKTLPKEVGTLDQAKVGDRISIYVDARNIMRASPADATGTMETTVLKQNDNTTVLGWKTKEAKPAIGASKTSEYKGYSHTYAPGHHCHYADAPKPKAKAKRKANKPVLAKDLPVGSRIKVYVDSEGYALPGPQTGAKTRIGTIVAKPRASSGYSVMVGWEADEEEVSASWKPSPSSFGEYSATTVSDTSKYVRVRYLYTADKCLLVSKPKTASPKKTKDTKEVEKKTTFQDTKLGDTITVYLNDRRDNLAPTKTADTVETTVIGVRGNERLIGWKTRPSGSSIGWEMKTEGTSYGDYKCVELGDYTRGWYVIGGMNNAECIIHSKEEPKKLSKSKKKVKAKEEPAVEFNKTIRDAKLGDRVRVRLRADSVIEATVISQAGFRTTLGWKKGEDLPAYGSWHITPSEWRDRIGGKIGKLAAEYNDACHCDNDKECAILPRPPKPKTAAAPSVAAEKPAVSETIYHCHYYHYH